MPRGSVRMRAAASKPSSVSSGARVANGAFTYEVAPELRTLQQRSETYRKMTSSDPHIAESVRGLTLPLIARAAWSCTPSVSDNPSAQLAADLVAANLYNQTSMSFGRAYFQYSPWSQRLREILTFLTYGFSAFYREWQRVEKYTVLRRLIWLEPDTIQKWVFEGADLTGIERKYKDESGTQREEFLEVKDLALYGWDIVGSRLEGNSLVRSMFGAWSRKEFLLRCKMVAAQRASVGIPWAKWDPANHMPPEDFEDQLEAMLANSLGAGIDSLYFQAPVPSLEISYLKQEAGDLEKFDNLADAENLALAHGGGTKAQMLGETASGSRALAEPMMTFQYILAEAIGGIIAEQEVWGVANVEGVASDLVRTNFPGADQVMPEIGVEDVDPDDKVRTLPLLISAIEKGAVARRPWIEKDILTRLGLDIPDGALDEDASYSRLLDPSTMRDAILGFEVVTKNELRAALGLPPLEGPEGEAWVKASTDVPSVPDQEPNLGSGSADGEPPAPTATSPSDGVPPPAPVEEGAPPPPSEPEPSAEIDEAEDEGVRAALTGQTTVSRPLNDVEKQCLDLPAILSSFDETTQDLTSVYKAGNAAMIEALLRLAVTGGFEEADFSSAVPVPQELRQRIVGKATSELVKMGTEAMKQAAAELVRQKG